MRVALSGASAGLAKERDSAGVAAELGDVVPHPFEGEDQVEHAGRCQSPWTLGPPSSAR